MVGIIIGGCPVVIIMALGDGMSWRPRIFTKDQQYVQISYSAQRVATWLFHLAQNHPCEEGVVLKVVGKVASQVKKTKECHHQLAMERKLAKMLDNPILVPPVGFRSKNWPRSPKLFGYYVIIQPMLLSFQKKIWRGQILWESMILISLLENLNWFQGRKLNASDYQSFSRVIMAGWRLSAFDLVWTESFLNQVVAVGDNNHRVVGIFKDPNAGSALYGASSSEVPWWLIPK